MAGKGFNQDTPVFEFKTWNSRTSTTSQDQRLYPYGIIGDCRARSIVKDAGTTARQHSTAPTTILATPYQKTSLQIPTPSSERKPLLRNKHTVLEQSEDIEAEIWAKMPAPNQRAYQDAAQKEAVQKVASKAETEQERLKRKEFKQAIKARIDELKGGE